MNNIDLALAGPTPVLYFDVEDVLRDGRGYNVLLADGATVDRFSTLSSAVEAFTALVQLTNHERR